jgi:hypothetical protein
MNTQPIYENEQNSKHRTVKRFVITIKDGSGETITYSGIFANGCDALIDAAKRHGTMGGVARCLG